MERANLTAPARPIEPAPEIAARTAISGAGSAAVLAAIGGGGFAAAFRVEDLTRPVLAAAVTGAAASLLVTGILRRRLALAAGVAALALAGVAAVVCDAPPDVVLEGLSDGPWTIFDSHLPVRSEPVVLVVPFAITGAAAFLGAEIAQRSRSALAPLLPSLAALVAGLLFGIDGRELPLVWLPAAWITAALMVTGVRVSRAARDVTVVEATVSAPSQNGHSPGTRASPPRATAGAWRGIAAVAVLAIPVATAARWISPRLPGGAERDRFELRELFGEEGTPAPQSSPLVGLTGLQSRSGEVLFTAETSAPVDRWRLAVLDAFDRTNWTSRGSFLPAGAELSAPPIDGSGDVDPPEGAPVEATIELGELDGRWLPVADRAVEIDVDDLFFDAAAGVAIVGDGSELPRRYTVLSEIPAPDTARLASAAAATDDESRQARELPPDMPEDLTTRAGTITEGGGSDYGRAVAIERYLAEPSPEATFQLAAGDHPGGHSLGHLRCFLINPDCAHTGPTEQFVATFALLARIAGLPTRIVVGFEGSGAAGRDEVTADEATAWAEVKFDGIGWVAFDPVPAPSVTTTPPTTVLPGGDAGPADNQPGTTVADDSANQTQGDEDRPHKEDNSSSSAPVFWFGGATALVVLGLLAPGLLRARRRRKRRRAADDDARLAGAWVTAVDELRRGGLPRTTGLAVSDIVVAGRDHYAGAAEPLVPLGVMVNRARFSPRAPDGGEADHAWELSDTFVSRRRKGRPASRRVAEYFSLRN